MGVLRAARRCAARAAGAGLLAIGVSSLGCSRALAPYGEAVVIVDTDLPPQALSAHLRVDTYTSDGVWLFSADTARYTTDDWPASFGVLETDLNAGRAIRVRLRVYPEQDTRDYRGERFAAEPTGGSPTSVVADPPPTSGPRLVVDGSDITPPTEPEPAVTVDRLIDIDLKPGVLGSVTVLLAGACLGTMADIVGDQTCIDTENTRVPTPLVSLSPSLALPPSHTGTYGLEPPCNVTPRTASTVSGVAQHDEEICVQGGPFVLGDDGTFGSGTADGALNAAPVRFAVAPSMLLDRYEVTVARWRAAVAKGFVAPFPVGTTEGPLLTAPPTDPSGDASLCTYSMAPSPGGQDREAYPMNCVRWDSARAFCKFIGSDLPTEAVWEYAALASSRPAKARFVSGGVPVCADLIYGRDGEPGTSSACITSGFGPVAVTANPAADVTPDGIVGMAGNVSEHVLDVAADYDSVCWETAGLVNPSCTAAGINTHVIRGTSWQDDLAAADDRLPIALADNNLLSTGFRCARPGAP